MTLTKTQKARNDKLDGMKIGSTVSFNALRFQSIEQVSQWARNRLRALKARGQNYTTETTNTGIKITRLANTRKPRGK